MPQIKIDPEKCTDCGLCALECASGSIQLRDGKAAVVMPQWCNLCSHCLAVCPAGAVIHSGLLPSGSRPVKRDKLDPECCREIVMTRRSVRHFRDEPLPRAEIEEVLDLAAYSPTASNTMDVGYVVVTDRELIRRVGRDIFATGTRLKNFIESPLGRLLKTALARTETVSRLMRYTDRFSYYREWIEAGRDPITHNAPALILIHGPRRSRFARENCAIAAANITNYAHARGLGTCYLGLVVVPAERDKKLRARLGIPPDRSLYLALALGRPAHRFANTAARPGPRVDWI